MPIEKPSSVTDGWFGRTESSQSSTYEAASLTASREYSIDAVSGNQVNPAPDTIGARTEATANSCGSRSARPRRSSSLAP